MSHHEDRELGAKVLKLPDLPDPGPSLPAEPGEPDAADLAAIAAGYAPVDWAAAWAAQGEEIDWLHGEFLERGTLNALFAKPGTGKSLVTLEVALSLIRAGHVVVYVDDENRITDLVERLQDFGATPDELDRLKVYSFAGLPALDTPAGGLHLLALAVANDAALVVLDTTTRMIQGNEDASDTFLQLYRCSLVRLKQRRITVLRLDHPGKDETRGQRGSSAKDGDVDTTWRLSTISEGQEYRLDRSKSRSGHGPGAFVLRREYAPHLRHAWEADRGGRPTGEAARIIEIISLLDRAGVPATAGRPTARAALIGLGAKVPNALLEMAIRDRKAAHGQRRAVAGSRGQEELPAAHTPMGGQPGSPAPSSGSEGDEWGGEES